MSLCLDLVGFVRRTQYVEGVQNVCERVWSRLGHLTHVAWFWSWDNGAVSQCPLKIPLGGTSNVSLSECVAGGGFPFSVRQDVPVTETIEAMREATRITHDPTIEQFGVGDALRGRKK